MFTIKQNYKDEGTDFMQNLVKPVLNRLYGVQIREDIKESYYCDSETWMKTENDENVFDYWKLSNGY